MKRPGGYRVWGFSTADPTWRPKPLTHGANSDEGTVMDCLWLCAECGWAIIGKADDAHSHHHTPDTFSHWIYEFCPAAGGGPPNQPTGRSIHASDDSGYYCDTSEPSVVGETFAMIAANAALVRIHGRSLVSRRGR